MFSLTLHNLWSHKRRLISTVLAIALGTAFLTGTLVLSDTMRATFSSVFTQANAGTDAIVATHRIDTDTTTQQGTLDQALVARLRGVAGVARAEGVVEGYGQLVGADGKPIGGSGPPTDAGNWVDDPGLNPYRLAEGRAPQTPDEVIVNRGAAKSGTLHVGDRTTLLTTDPVPVTIVGLSTFGDADSSSGVTSTAFTLEGAQRHVLHQPDKISRIKIAAQPGVSQDQLVERIRPTLPAGVEAKTGAQDAADQQRAINANFLDFFTTFLTVFAAIALLVAAFSIYNTFTILVAQRSRDAALLRALGATRGQVLTATVTEALVIGLAASALGIVGGLGVAALLRQLFAAFGSDLPASGLTLTGGTVLLSMVVGTVVTLLAAFLPARRSSRIAPIAALRDVAIDRTHAGVIRITIGVVLGIVGVGLTVTGVSASTLAVAALGAAATLAALVTLGPVLAGPGSRIIGWPLQATRGITGELARENARRNPRRTSATAAALMVGVTVVTLFTVFASSLTSSVAASVQRAFGGDLVVTAGPMGGAAGFSPALARDIAARPEVAGAVGMGQAGARIDGQDRSVGVADPRQLVRVLDIGVIQGSVADLGPTALAVSDTFARTKGWTIGSAVPMAFVDGAESTFTVGAIYTGSDVVGDLAMSRAAWAPHAQQDLDDTVLVALAPGVRLADGKALVEQIARPYAGTVVQDREEYLASVASSINRTLRIIYVMLALAVLIALMGIANTLALSVLERRRELGLLRAVGETRRQVRSMIRGESMIIAVFGTLGGLGLGLFFGWALVRAASSQGIGVFAAAPSQLAVVLVAGAGAGVLAAVRPARQAARLDVLTAIAQA